MHKDPIKAAMGESSTVLVLEQSHFLRQTARIPGLFRRKRLNLHTNTAEGPPRLGPSLSYGSLVSPPSSAPARQHDTLHDNSVPTSSPICPSRCSPKAPVVKSAPLPPLPTLLPPLSNLLQMLDRPARAKKTVPREEEDEDDDEQTGPKKQKRQGEGSVAQRKPGCECLMCGKAFTRSDHLTEHMLTHTGDRPHKCTVCNQAFSQASNLTRHMRTHSGLRPYKCTTCGNDFRSSCNRAKHMRTHERQSQLAAE